MKKFLTKRTAIIGTGIVLVILVAVLSILWFVPGGSTTPPPTPTPSSVAPPADNENDATNVTGLDLTTTTQYAEAVESEYSSYLGGINPGETEIQLFPLAAWTVGNFVEEAYLNPYFLNNYWGLEDDYREDSLETYIYPYLSSETRQSYSDALTSGAPTLDSGFWNSRLYLQAAGNETSAQCYETWADEDCIVLPTGISNMSFTSVGETQIQVDVTVDMQVQYQDVNSTVSGNIVVEPRTYQLSFLVSFANEPTALDTEEPIMIVDSLEGTLVIGETRPYITNEQSGGQTET